MALEQYNSANFSQEAELMEKMNEFKGASNEFAVDTIKNLNEAQLTNFIEKSFKDGGDERETYSEMKKNPFYPFMVQAAIDLLGSKLKTGENKNKYNDNGEIDENGKTLDEHMRDNGGIDNKYGGGTRKTVTLVQNILKIHPDGFAGPQFFAKVCSVLKGEPNVSNFKVKGYNSDRPYGYGFENSDIPNPKQGTEQQEAENSIKESLGLKEFTDYLDNRYYGIPDGKQIFTREGHNGYYYVDGNKIIFIPNLKEEDKNMPVVQTLDNISQFKKGDSEEWIDEYPNGCENFRAYLNKKFENALITAGISTDDKSIEFSNGKYYIKSFNQDMPIDLTTLSDKWVSSGDDSLGNDFKLLNLCNWIQSQKITGKTFKFGTRGKTYVLVHDKQNFISPDKCERMYGGFRDIDKNKFINYLNLLTI